jgi:hypothetical protein
VKMDTDLTQMDARAMVSNSKTIIGNLY